MDEANVYSCSVSNCGDDNEGHGIFTEACRDATISYNTVSNCEVDGIHAWDNALNANTQVSYNDIYNCEIGIWRGRGHWDTDHNEIYNCEIGIYTDDYDQADVEYNDIYVKSGGIGIQVLNSNPTLYNNYITKYSTSNGAYGIYCGYAGPDPWVSSNEIEYMNTGIYCGANCGNSNKFRSNEISYCSTAIHTNGCNPDFGTSSNPGNHNIHNITNWFFKVENAPQTVKAEKNWWGSDPPNANKFSGNVDYNPWLDSAP